MYIEITPTNNIVTFRYQTTPDYDSEVIDFAQLKQDLVVTLKYENGAWIASHNYNQIATAIAEGVLVRLTDETNSRYAIMGEYGDDFYSFVTNDGETCYFYKVTDADMWSLSTSPAINVADNLTTDDPDMALSARQGVVLKGGIDDLEDRIYGGTIDETAATRVENGRYVRYTWTASANYRSYFFERTDIKRVRCSLYGGGSTDVAISAYSSTSNIGADTCLMQVLVNETGSGNIGSYDVLIPDGAQLVVISNRSQYGAPTVVIDTRGDLPVTPEAIDIKSVLPVAERGYIKTDGTITEASGYAVTDMIPVEALDKFLVSSYLSASYVMMYGYFDAEGTTGIPLYKGEGSQVIDKAMYVYDPRVRFVRICSRAASGDTVSFVQIVRGSVEEITGELEANSNVSHDIPFLAKAKRLNADGTTTDNTAYNSTEFIPVKKGDVLMYNGFLGSTATALCGYSGDSDADFEMVLIPTRGNVVGRKVVIPDGITHIRACSRCNYGDTYSLTLTTQAFGDILTEAMPTLKNLEMEFARFAGKRIAVIGDSIASGSNLNPYIRIQASDVGNTIQSYITYFDVYNLAGTALNKTIGGVAVTEDMIGTQQSFVPVSEDIGKTLGDAVAYYNGEVSWPYFMCTYLGATLINASWSGASMCSGQSQQVRALSYAWSDLTIGRCATRDEAGNTVAPDIIVICRGVNDMSHAQGSKFAVLEDYDIAANGYPVSDALPDDEYSFTRAYLLTIKKLRDAYPNAVIYCATLNVFKRVIYDRFPTRNGQYSLPDMNAKIRDIAATMGCRVISFDNDGITFENCYPTYISDSEETPTHPNITGQKVMAVKALNDLLVGDAGSAGSKVDLSNYVTLDTLNSALATKQDTIGDLADIREGAALGATAYQKPTTGIPASDLAEGVIPAPEIFWATYGTTTAAQIDAAVAAGKVVMCKHDRAQRVFTMVLYSSTATVIYFGSAFSSSLAYASLRRSDNVWSYGNPGAENVANKASTIAGNETDITKYPNTKAVYDAIVGAKEIFWATYGTTTAASISAAVAAGKIVAVKVAYSSGSNDHIHYLSQTLNSTRYEFFALDTIGGNYLYVVKCNKSNNAWNQGRVALQGTGELIDTLAHLIDNRTSETKYPSAKATFDGLGQYGIVSQTQTWSGTGSNPRTYVMSNQVWGLIPQANIDLFASAGATFNATTGYFELNGLTDISYEEMRNIYSVGQYEMSATNSYRYQGKIIRTIMPATTSGISGNRVASAVMPQIFFMSKIERVQFLLNDGVPTYLQVSNLSSAFNSCVYLREIPELWLTTTISSQSLSNAFSSCYSLEAVKLKNLGKDVSFSGSSLLDLDSIVYMVDNAANTSAITITLHATAYARCQADTTEYTYGGQTYTGILNYASAKNITIAS